MAFNPQPKPTKTRKKGVKSSGGKLHMGRIKELPCAACYRSGPSDCHHVFHDRYSGKKASDFATIPLCKNCHQHGMLAIHKRKALWRMTYGPDWSYIPQTLKAIYGDQWNIDH